MDFCPVLPLINPLTDAKPNVPDSSHVPLGRPADLLVAGQLVEQLADVADAEQRGGVQVRQNLDQDLRGQPEDKVTRPYDHAIHRSTGQQPVEAQIVFNFTIYPGVRTAPPTVVTAGLQRQRLT